MPADVIAVSGEHAIESAAGTLRSGGIVIFPTDTLPGISTLISNRRGQERIRKLKQASPDRPFIMLAGSVEMVSRYVESFGCSDQEQLAAAWPAPLTAVLPAGSGCPDWIGRTVAFRVPQYGPVIELVSRLDEPIVSTSVNVTGKLPLTDAGRIGREFAEEVDLIVLAAGSPSPSPSTIVDLTGNSPRVVRHGAYEWPG